MTVVGSMLQAGWQDLTAVIISEARDVQKGSHVFASYVLMITRWQLSLLFQFCSHIILVQMADYTPLACY